jgi:aspartyl-tRNA(Asn)/glutamyl-tRNA(Gln) amidotransferase subunit C
MQVNDQLITDLAKLARLQFSPTEKESLLQDLQRMITFVEKLQEVNTAGIQPLLHMGHALNAYRQDKVTEEHMDRTTALANAPGANDQYFKVPKVIKQNNTLHHE